VLRGLAAASFASPAAAQPARTATLRFAPQANFPLLLDALAKPDANVPFVMPERLAATDANAQVGEVVGSGPYRFLRDELVSGSRVAYARFDGYLPRQEAPDWASGGKVAHFRASSGTSSPTRRPPRRRCRAARWIGWNSPSPTSCPR
jgi:hypothetical protein